MLNQEAKQDPNTLDVKSNHTSKSLSSKALDIIPNRFMLAVVLSKRARQLKDGMNPMVKVNREIDWNPLDVAMEELICGKLRVDFGSPMDSEEAYIQEIEQTLEVELRSEDTADKKDPDEKKKESKKKSKSLAA